jgi:hypothetical protein
LLKKNSVNKISHLRSQNKKAPKFSHFIKITLLRNSLLKKYDFLGIFKIFLTGFHCRWNWLMIMPNGRLGISGAEILGSAARQLVRSIFRK